MPDSTPAPLEIGVTALDGWRKAGRAVAILDVREPWEVERAALAGALAIPMGQVPERLAEIPDESPLVVVCHHGGRSMRVAMWLRRNGRPGAVNLAGGIDAWSRQIDHTIPVY